MKLLSAILLLFSTISDVSFARSSESNFRGSGSYQDEQEGPDDCDDGCDIGKVSPVCGIDGNTYFNECLAICQEVEIERDGACPLDPPMNFDSIATEGKVTKAEMDAHKAGKLKFKLIAKQKSYGSSLYKERPEGEISGTSTSSAQSHTKAFRFTRDGLVYVANYSLDDISESMDEPKEQFVTDHLPEEDQREDPNRRLFWMNELAFEQDSYDWPTRRIVEIDYNPQCDNSGCSGDVYDTFQTERCSGVIIGNSKVLTAASCLFSGRGAPAARRVAPGRSSKRSPKDPFGVWFIESSDVPSQWTYGKDPTYNFAVLTIVHWAVKLELRWASYS